MASPGVHRMLYCFMGDDVRVDGTRVQAKVGARLDASRPVSLESQGGPAGFLLLQGRQIGAPVVQLGPFVMNAPEELRQAVDDYRRTSFGG